MSCHGLYLNPGFSPRPTEFLPALSKNRIPVGTRRGPTKDPPANDSMSTHWPTQRAQSFRWITESCPDPVTGRAVGEEDYSHSNYTYETLPHEKTHTQKETGRLNREKSVSARDKAKGEGR